MRESLPLRSSRVCVSPDPFMRGTPPQRPHFESSRRACSVPPLRGSYGPAPSGASGAAGCSTARPAMALRARLLAAFAWWRYAPSLSSRRVAALLAADFRWAAGQSRPRARRVLSDHRWTWREIVRTAGGVRSTQGSHLQVRQAPLGADRPHQLPKTSEVAVCARPCGQQFALPEFRTQSPTGVRRLARPPLAL